jgi:opacity protein-like surface antigen
MRLRVALIAGVALCALASPAFAAQGWYVAVGAGWAKMNDFDFDGFGINRTAFSNGGFIGTGAVGYKMGAWRFELEGSGSHNKFVGNYEGGTVWTGVSANALYDFHFDPRWSAYVGGGVGVGGLNREAYGFGDGAGEFMIFTSIRAGAPMSAAAWASAV